MGKHNNYTKEQQTQLVKLTGMPVENIEKAKDADLKKHRLPKKHDTEQQKRLIDAMLEKIPDMIDRSKDPQGFQQLTNSMAQLIRLRQEVDNTTGVKGDDADQMDSAAERARAKMLGFARDE